MKIGDVVNGTYEFHGKIVAEFNRISGGKRFVIEDSHGFLLIFKESQLSALEEAKLNRGDLRRQRFTK
jgi:hypothetical protein